MYSYIILRVYIYIQYNLCRREIVGEAREDDAVRPREDNAVRPGEDDAMSNLGKDVVRPREDSA